MKNENEDYRIELYEKYIANQEQLEYFEELGIDTEKNTNYQYRRTYALFNEIERPIEIVGNKEECIIRFWSGEEIIIKESYDDFVVLMDDIRAGKYDIE
jgi:hypothetical protein